MRSKSKLTVTMTMEKRYKKKGYQSTLYFIFSLCSFISHGLCVCISAVTLDPKRYIEKKTYINIVFFFFFFTLWRIYLFILFKLKQKTIDVERRR